MTSDTSIAARLQAEVDARRLEFDSSQQEAAGRLDHLREALAQPPSVMMRLRARLSGVPAAPRPAPRGVYLWGGVGRGKTLLMDWFHESLPPSQSERIHFYRFMRDVHSQLNSIKQRSEPLETVAQRLSAQVRVICLDEFFVADIADAMLLAGLFQALFSRGVTLVATSNAPPQDLYQDGLQRQRFLPAIALLERHMDIVHLDGGIDYRLRQLEQAATYFDSALADSAALLARRFTALAGGSERGPTALTVENRRIEACATGAGMVWFDFEQICEGPRSQNDYIEIARLYHTVFISDIPLFTSDNENAARRFITLIDEFYDRNVNIVISAAAAPGSLYQGERLQFDFKRTASRLIEMQTLEYLAGRHRP